METENLEICARRRLETELREFQTKPLENITCGPLSEEDMFRWQAIIIGPVDTPDESDIFILSIQFPIDYPFNPPEVQFQTQVSHPNIDENGRVDISILRDQWSSALSTEALLITISSILFDPILEDIHYPVSNLDPLSEDIQNPVSNLSNLDPIPEDIRNPASNLDPMPEDIRNPVSNLDPIPKDICNPASNFDPIPEDIRNPVSNLDPIPKDICNPASNLDPIPEDIRNPAPNLDWHDTNYCYKKPRGWKKKYERLLRCWSRIKLLLLTKNQSDRLKPGRDK